MSVGTQLAEGKEERVLKGKKYVLQESLHADVALIKAKKQTDSEILFTANQQETLIQ